MAYALVQHTKAAFNATSSWNLGFGSNVVSGNRITAQNANSNTAVLNGWTDNAGGGSNSYALDDSKSDATVGGLSSVGSAQIVRGGGSALTVTASYTANQSGEMFIQEFSGLDTALNIVRTKGENVDTVGNTAHSATSAASSVSGDLVLGFDNGGATETSITAANGTTLIDSDLSSASATVHKAGTGIAETAGVTVAPSDTYIFITVVYKLLAVAVTVPLVARTALKRTIPTPRGRAQVAPISPFVPSAPLKARQRLVAVVPTPKSRAKVIVLPPMLTAPLAARERLVPVVLRRFGKGKVATAGPAPATPVVARHKIIPTPPALRAKAQVAGAGPLAAKPLTIRQKLIAVAPALRSRAKVAPFVPTLVLAARTRLVAVVRTPRSAARVAGTGPLAATPLRAIQRLVRSLPRIRAAFNNFLQIFRVPTFGPGVVLVSDFRKNQVTVSDTTRARVLVSDFRIRAVQEKDILI